MGFAHNPTGVDSIVVGPNDLSGSIGLLGQTGHQEVKKLMDSFGETARKFKKPSVFMPKVGDKLEALKTLLTLFCKYQSSKLHL